MESRICTLEVRVHGKSVREWRHEGKCYIEGRKGSEFILRILNRSHARVLAVPSVDGLSVMDGEVASANSNGYVLQANSHLDIPGWRVSDEEVAKFIFSKLAEAYATKTVTSRNVGVIGLAVFHEHVHVDSIIHTWRLATSHPPCQPCQYYYTPSHSPVYGTSQTNVAPDTFAYNASCHSYSFGGDQLKSEHVENVNFVQQSVGTGFGQASEHRVSEVSFVKATTAPADVLEIFYDSREGLRKRGVNLDIAPKAQIPQAFPGASFCKPPSGWRR
jgi:hypothetical protein